MPASGTNTPKLRLIREGFPSRPAYGTAVSEAQMLRVAAGEEGQTLRLHRPGRELAFAKQDRAAPGFAEAVQAARAIGFEPVIRLAGGRAAIFHEQTLAFAWSSAAARPTRETHDRFRMVAGVIRDALITLGVDARIGEVPGEYCPGAWSVNAGGRRKLAGIGQRIVTGGAHVGGVLVVGGSDLARSALEPVYSALGLDWDPETTGAVDDEVADVTLELAEEAIVAELGKRFELVEARFDERTLERARELERNHLVA